MALAPVRFGLLSTAAINAEILAAARVSDYADVAAVASRDRARADVYARQHGIPRAHGDHQELLDDPHVDAVYISLPNALHAEWSIRALEAGKHVLCEKPFSRHPDEVERAFDAAERAGRWLTEGLVSRHHPQSDRVVELVEHGVVGELRTLSATFSFDLADPENTRMHPELGGGALMDVGCYCVSSLRAVAGEPERVYAEQVVHASGVDLRAAATLRFAGCCGRQNREDRSARDGRANTHRTCQRVPARARKPVRRSRWRGGTAARTRRRAWTGACSRCATA